MSAPLGNQNAKKAKPWADAIRRALARREADGKGDDLNALAERLINAGLGGDLAALRELGDRLDGKAAQAIVGDADHDPVRLEEIKRSLVRPNEG